VANLAQMVNVLQAMILTDEPKMLPTPTYHVWHMYVPFQGAKVVPVGFDARTYTYGNITLSRVDAMAPRGTDGKLSLSLTNVDPNKPARITASVVGPPRRWSGANRPGHRFAQQLRPAEQHCARGVRTTCGGRADYLQLPPKSVAVVEVQ
jgi:alpha-N-arabinofuranosidase